MARVRKNLAMQGLTGKIGDQFVIRTDKAGRTIVGTKPSFSEGRQYSEAQLTHQEAFREAVAYAKSSKDLDIYVQKAGGTPQNAYNVAVADWFNKPEIKELDVTEWNGAPGQTIRVRAMDDVQVTEVSVVITDSAGVVQEQGQAAQADGLWWHYTTNSTAPETPRLVVTARDLPGHTAQMNWD
jgi:hypothetical protein